jgi:hypothetical protein
MIFKRRSVSVFTATVFTGKGREWEEEEWSAVRLLCPCRFRLFLFTRFHVQISSSLARSGNLHGTTKVSRRAFYFLFVFHFLALDAKPTGTQHIYPDGWRLSMFYILMEKTVSCNIRSFYTQHTIAIIHTYHPHNMTMQSTTLPTQPPATYTLASSSPVSHLPTSRKAQNPRVHGIRKPSTQHSPAQPSPRAQTPQVTVSYPESTSRKPHPPSANVLTDAVYAWVCSGLTLGLHYIALRRVCKSRVQLQASRNWRNGVS